MGSNIGLHGGIDSLGLRSEAVGVGTHLAVGLLDLLGGLSLEGQKGACKATDSIFKCAGGELLVSSDLASKSSTGGSVLGGGGSLLVRSGGKLGLGVLGGEAETLDLRSSLLGVLGDLGGNAGVHRRLGLGVEILEFGLGSGHARLATGNGLGDRGLPMLLVRLHDGGEHGTALGRLDGVGTDDAGELVHLLLELLVVLDNGGVEGTEALAEILLGSTEGILNIEAGLTGLGGKRSIGLGLELLALGNSSIELTGLLLEHVSGMRTVLLHGA